MGVHGWFLVDVNDVVMIGGTTITR